MKIKRFEDIEAWQQARKLVQLVYSAIGTSDRFQKDFRLSNKKHRGQVTVKWSSNLTS